NNHVRYGYDVRDRVVWRAVYGPNPPAYGKPSAQQLDPQLASMVELQWDGVDRVIEIDRWHFSNGQAIGELVDRTNFVYDDVAKTVTQVHGNRVVVASYDGNGRPLGMRWSDGNTTITRSATYEQGGDRVIWTTPTAAANGTVVSTMNLDGLGLIASVVDGDNR